MSLEIQDKFASTYAKYGWDKDNWQVQPHRIGHIFMDWFSTWLGEHESQNLGKEYTDSPHPESVVREMFGVFFDSLKQRNHVYVPEDVQEKAILEYLED